MQRRYVRVVAGEFLLLVAVGVVLGLALGAEWAAVWVCAVVGLHFLPLARVLPGLGLPLLGAGITVVAVAALVVGAVTDVPPVAVTGPGPACSSSSRQSRLWRNSPAGSAQRGSSPTFRGCGHIGCPTGVARCRP